MALDVVFMGTPEFSVPVLEAVAAAGHRILAVYSQPPRPAGRGMAERPSPVHAAALSRGIEVRTPKSLRSAEEQARFAGIGADVAIVVAYGLILPKAILEAPRHGCLNLHASALPRWRGAAPIQRAIMAGDTGTAVMVMRMEEGLDTGPVALAAFVPIGPADTARTLHDRLALRGAPLMVEALARLEAGALTAEPQAASGVTYAAKIDKAEARIDFARPARDVHNLIRGLSPFPGAWFEVPLEDGGAERIKALGAEFADGVGAPGTVLDGHLTIACGDGAIRLTNVQRAGKKPQTAAELLRGFRIAPGTRVS